MGLGWSKFIEYFLRVVTKFARRINTSSWPVFNATVVSSKRDECFTGCILIIIHYKYRNADRRFEGTYKQPFIFDNYADAYLRRYPGGSEFPVLVSPKEPSYSIPVEGKIVFTRVD
jgi:hypothetical protein